MSIGDASFGQDLRAALEDDDLVCSQEGDEDYEDDLLEDGLAATSVAPVLLPTPEATQEPDGFTFGQAGAGNDEDDRKDEQKREELTSMHPTLTSMTRKISGLYEEQAKQEAEHEDANPFLVLKEKHDIVSKLGDGDDKNDSIKMFNSVATLFSAARRNPVLREFLADLFNKTGIYYSLRERKQKTAHELSLMLELRREAERENFVKKQRMREEEESAASKKKRRM